MSKILLCVLVSIALASNCFALEHSYTDGGKMRHSPEAAAMSKLHAELIPQQARLTGISTASNIGQNWLKSRESTQSDTPDSVGFTWWDEQTPSAMPNMCANFAGGVGSMVTLVQGTQNGTTGNYFATNTDASIFKPTSSGGKPLWKSIENTSSLFCALAYRTSDYNEIVVSGSSTIPATATLTCNIISTTQTGTWKSHNITGSAGGMCPSVAVSDSDVIHVLYSTFMTAQDPSKDIDLFYHPCNVMYTSSRDSGVTWSTPVTIASSIMPGAYVMTASGANVAMVYNFLGNIETYVSHDNGNNFDFHGFGTGGPNGPGHQRGPDSAGVSGHDTTHYLSDEGLVYGNQFDALIDPTGKIHFAVHYIYAFIDSAAKGSQFLGYSWVEGLHYSTSDKFAGIVYFNNDTSDGSYHTYLVGAAEGDSSGILKIAAPDQNYLVLGNREVGSKTFPASWTAQPQLGYNVSKGSVYIVYQSYNQNDVVPLVNGGNTFLVMNAHLYSVASVSADYKEWSYPPVPLTPDGVDARYPSLADNVDDHAVLSYIQDYYPGQTTEAFYYYTAYPQHPCVAIGKSIPSDALTLVGVNEGRQLTLGTFELAQNYPNPFNPTTWVRYSLPNASNVRLEVFDMVGRSVAVLARGKQSAGIHTAAFDATNLPSGMYTYTLTAGTMHVSHTMALTK